MGNRYWVTRAAFTATAAQDSITLISAASRRLRVLQLLVNGQGGSSAPQGFTATRGAAGTTPGGAIVPSKADHNDQPAATFTTATTWSVQPAIDANGATLSFNALGGKDQWTATQLTKGVLEARNGEIISIRPTSGPTPQSTTLSALVEED